MLPSTRSTRLWLLAAAFTLCLAVVDDADARGLGKGAARSGHVSKQTTRTGPQGGQRTWSKETSWERGGGQASRDTTWTGPRGGQTTRSDQASRTEQGWQRDTTWTDRKGRTATREVEGTLDREAGQRTRDVTFTGRDGETRTRQDVTTRTDDGRERVTIVTRPDGSVVVTERSVSRELLDGAAE